MSTPVLPDYAAPYKPVPNVTPFTIRDGATMLKKIDYINKYIDRVLIPWINENFAELADDFEEQVNILIAAVNAAIQLVIDDSIEVQDPVMRTILENMGSESRVTLNNILSEYYTKLEANAEFETKTGAANTFETKQAANVKFDDRYTKEESDNAINALTSSLNPQIAALESEISDVKTEISGGAISESAVRVKIGGDYHIGVFEALRNGVKNPSTQTRVVFLGESHIFGGHTKYPTQGFVNRLAARARSSAVTALNTVSAPVTGPGMRWYNGGVNSAGTGQYYPLALHNNLVNVNPDYVFHHIGVNDFSQQFTLESFKDNLRAALSQIEASVPGAKNIVIHSFGLPAPAIVTIPWSAYGQAQKDVVNENPTQRTFVDFNESMSALGMDANNIGGLLSSDKVHLNEIGAKFYADIASAYFGIPTERTFANEQVFEFPKISPAVNTVDATLSTLAIPAVNYPRYVNVVGSIYAPSSASEATAIGVSQTSNGASAVRQTLGTKTQGKFALNTTLYIPPGTDDVLRVQLFMNSGSTITLNDEPLYSTVKAIATPA